MPSRYLFCPLAFHLNTSLSLSAPVLIAQPVSVYLSSHPPVSVSTLPACLRLSLFYPPVHICPPPPPLHRRPSAHRDWNVPAGRQFVRRRQLDGERLPPTETQRVGRLAGLVLQRHDAHADQVTPVDPLVRLGNHRSHTLRTDGAGRQNQRGLGYHRPHPLRTDGAGRQNQKGLGNHRPHPRDRRGGTSEGTRQSPPAHPEDGRGGTSEPEGTRQSPPAHPEEGRGGTSEPEGTRQSPPAHPEEGRGGTSEPEGTRQSPPAHPEDGRGGTSEPEGTRQSPPAPQGQTGRDVRGDSAITARTP